MRLLIVVNKAQFNLVNSRCETYHTPIHTTQSINQIGASEASLKFNFISSKVKLMNYLIYFEGDIILYYDIYKENK